MFKIFKEILPTLGISWRVINTIVIVVACFAPWLSIVIMWGNIALNGFETAVFAGFFGSFMVASSLAYGSIGSLPIGFLLVYIFLGIISLGLYLIAGFIGYISSLIAGFVETVATPQRIGSKQPVRRGNPPSKSAFSVTVLQSRFIGYFSSHLRLATICLLFPATFGIASLTTFYLLKPSNDTLQWGYWLTLAGVISSIALELVESCWIVVEKEVLDYRTLHKPSFSYNFLLKIFTFICAALLMTGAIVGMLILASITRYGICPLQYSVGINC